MSQCLGIRGATTADANSQEAIVEATAELLRELVAANSLAENDVAAVFFTTTVDLNAGFPAIAARLRLGWTHTALMCGQEIPVPGDPARVIRTMLLVNTDRRKEDLVHVYMKGSQDLRRGTPEQ